MKHFTEHTRRSVTRSYVVIFYLLAAMKWLQGGWLYQYEPYVFRTRFDGFTWLFMQSGLHRFIIAHPSSAILLDLIFYGMPAFFFWASVYRPKWVFPVAVFMLVGNWVYVQVYTLYPTNSIEAHVAWLLFPILFICRKLKTFYLVLNGLRYYFFFFFGSAGLWKIYEGGVFNRGQMSNILLYQHAPELAGSPDSSYTRFLYSLVRNEGLSYGLFVTAVACQVSFLAGFFTRRLDRLLLLVFLAFLVMDHVLMKINYTEVLPLAIPLWYSRYEMPED